MKRILKSLVSLAVAFGVAVGLQSLGLPSEVAESGAMLACLMGIVISRAL